MYTRTEIGLEKTQHGGQALVAADSTHCMVAVFLEPEQFSLYLSSMSRTKKVQKFN